MRIKDPKLSIQAEKLLDSRLFQIKLADGKSQSQALNPLIVCIDCTDDHWMLWRTATYFQLILIKVTTFHTSVSQLLEISR